MGTPCCHCGKEATVRVMQPGTTTMHPMCKECRQEMYQSSAKFMGASPKEEKKTSPKK